MIDWTASMQRSFEFYEVDPRTWFDIRQLDFVESCNITKDLSKDTIQSMSISVSENIGEIYIRVYMVVYQNGKEYKLPIGTFLSQTPSYSFDGKVRKTTLDCFSPLIELKEKKPPLGYTVLKGSNILKYVHDLCQENMRGPIGQEPSGELKTLYDNLTAASGDTWLSFLVKLAQQAQVSFKIDHDSRLLFEPNVNIAAMSHVYEFTDDNSSILYPDISLERDLYGIPNVVEVVSSTADGYFYAKVTNDDPGSLTSTVSRGREIHYRETNPSLGFDINEESIKQYAEGKLRELNSLEYTVSFKHGYHHDVNLGDCVRLNYESAGIRNVKARIISQSLECNTECSVNETAVFTVNLWKATAETSSSYEV